jgi:hypothetical protein
MASPSLAAARIRPWTYKATLDAGEVPASYQCQDCRMIWSQNIQTGGRMPRGWWRCPRGCNHDVTTGRK